jgi:hypothetical protein
MAIAKASMTRLVRMWSASCQPELAHQVGDQPDVARMTVAVGLRGHPAAALGTPPGVGHPTDVLTESPAPRSGRGFRSDLAAPGVERRPWYCE